MIATPSSGEQAGDVQGEIEWLDPEGVSAAEEERLELGSSSPVSTWLARASLWPSRRPRPGRIALVPIALLAALTLGPSGPGATHADHRPVKGGSVIWTCRSVEPPAADALPAARNLPGSLLAEQMPRWPHGPGMCPEPGDTWRLGGITGADHDRFAGESSPGGRRT